MRNGLNSVNETIKVEDRQNKFKLFSEVAQRSNTKIESRKTLQIASQPKTIPSENF